MPAAGDIGLCAKVCMGLYGGFSENQRYLQFPIIPHCQMLDSASPRSNSNTCISSTWQHLESPKYFKSTVDLCETGFPGTNRRLAVFKTVWQMANRMRNFQSPGFPHNFSKNYCLQLKLAVSTRLDVSYNL